MELDNVIKERHSVRNFKKTKKPNWRDIIEAIDAAIKAPLAGNISTLRFILVFDEKEIKELAEACQEKFVSDVSYIVVVCSKTERNVKSYGERGHMYCRQQAGAAIENFLLKLTEMGLATCWIGAFSDEQVKRILEIPEDIYVEALLPIGYEMGKGKQRTKPDLGNVIFYNKWNVDEMKPWKTPEAL